MLGGCYLQGSGFEGLRDSEFGDHLRRPVAYYVASEKLLRGGVEDHLDETVGFSDCDGLSDGPEGKPADVHLVAPVPRLFFRKTYHGDFRLAVDASGNRVVVHPGIHPLHSLDGHHSFLRCLVGQHGSPDHVSYGVHAGAGGHVVAVGLYEPPLVELHSHVGKSHVVARAVEGEGRGSRVGDRLSSHRHENHVGLYLLLLSGGSVLDRHRRGASRFPEGLVGGVGKDGHSLLSEYLLGFRGHFPVGSGHDVLFHLYHRHPASE